MTKVIEGRVDKLHPPSHPAYKNLFTFSALVGDVEEEHPRTNPPNYQG